MYRSERQFEAGEYCGTVETTFDPLRNTVRYGEKPTDNVC